MTPVQPPIRQKAAAGQPAAGAILYGESFFSDKPADGRGTEALALRSAIQHFPDEAVYVYCFRRRQLIYADGFPAVLGFADDDITMLRITQLTTPQFAPFLSDITEKALQFLQTGHPGMEQYSFTVELKKFHRLGHEVPLIMRVGVYEADDDGVVSIIGRLQLAPNLRFGKVMRYAAYGPEKNLFEEELSKTLFAQPAISGKEREALCLVAGGAPFKEIADRLRISQSAVEKRILPLYKRFGVSSLPHLVSYAHDNGILP